jgi:hypothetical protein
MFARRPLDQALVRRLVVLKLWQARDTFDPARLMAKFEEGREFDWDDLRQLCNRTVILDRERICADCVRGFGFLVNLTDDERTIAGDRYQREQAIADKLRAGVRKRRPHENFRKNDQAPRRGHHGTRGRALFAVMEYCPVGAQPARTLASHLKRPVTLDVMPEVREILDRHLDMAATTEWWPATPSRFMRVVNKVRLELRLHRRRHRH